MKIWSTGLTAVYLKLIFKVKSKYLLEKLLVSCKSKRHYCAYSLRRNAKVSFFYRFYNSTIILLFYPSLIIFHIPVIFSGYLVILTVKTALFSVNCGSDAACNL